MYYSKQSMSAGDFLKEINVHQNNISSSREGGKLLSCSDSDSEGERFMTKCSVMCRFFFFNLFYFFVEASHFLVVVIFNPEHWVSVGALLWLLNYSQHWNNLSHLEKRFVSEKKKKKKNLEVVVKWRLAASSISRYRPSNGSDIGPPSPAGTEGPHIVYLSPVTSASLFFPPPLVIFSSFHCSVCVSFLSFGLRRFFSSLTSMRNWMVFDYYMAVRLTAINWIESQSTSFTSLRPSPPSLPPPPLLVWSRSHFPSCLSRSLFFVTVFFFLFIPSVLLCPCFFSLSLFLSVCPPLCFLSFIFCLPPSFFLSSSSHLSLSLFLPTCPSSFTGFLSSFSSPPHAPSLLFSPSLLSVSPPSLPFTLILPSRLSPSLSTVILLSWWRPSFSGMNGGYFIDETAWQREREREREGEERGEGGRERKKKRQKKRKKKKGEKPLAGENPNDMEMIVPAAYDTKHFHPVICSALMSQRGRCKPRHAESSSGVWDSQGCWRIPPPPKKPHYYSSLSPREKSGGRFLLLGGDTLVSASRPSLSIFNDSCVNQQHNEMCGVFLFLWSERWCFLGLDGHRY